MAVSNKDVEVLSEAMFCYYFAIWVKGKKNQYSPSDWNNITTKSELTKWTNKFGITPIIDRVNKDQAFTSRLDKVREFLNEKGWHERLVKQLDAFVTKFTPRGTFFAMRADMILPAWNPYRVYKTISAKAKTAYGFRGKVDPDKWNPSDVWIFTNRSKAVLQHMVVNLNNRILNNEEYCVGYLNLMNNKVYDLFKRKLLYPVSLKAPGASVHITLENSKASTIQKVVRFTQLKYENNNQDAKIGFAVDKYDKEQKKTVKKDYIVGNIKTKTVKSGGARLEIEAKGGSARYGSMGTENYQWIIKETDNSGIKELNNLRKKYPKLNKYWTGSTGKDWLGRKGYVQAFNKDPQAFKEEIEPYAQELYRHVNDMPWDPSRLPGAKSPEEAWLNKVHAGEVGIAVNDIINKFKRDIVTENLFNLAASQRFGAGVSRQQLEARKNMIDQKFKGELEAIPLDESKTIWNACFYIVVK